MEDRVDGEISELRRVQSYDLAPQGQRTPALLNWAQSLVGCGLDKLEAVINTVVNSDP